MYSYIAMSYNPKPSLTLNIRLGRDLHPLPLGKGEDVQVGVPAHLPQSLVEAAEEQDAVAPHHHAVSGAS